LLQASGISIKNIFTCSRIQNALDLINESIDIVLLDLSLPDSKGINTYKTLRKHAGDIPVVILSGMSDKQLALESIQLGAQDYLIKGDFDEKLLAKTILYGIERKKTASILMESEERYRYLFNNNPASILIWNPTDFKIIEVNDSCCREYQYSKEVFLTKSILDLQAPEDLKELLLKDHPGKRTFLLKKISRRQQVNQAGEIFYMDIASHNIEFNYKTRILSLGINVTENVLLENKIAAAKAKNQKEITEAVFEAQEKEKQAMGRELHDNVNQLLSSSRLYLGLARGNENQRVQFLDQCEGLITAAIAEIRLLSHSLIPPSLAVSELQEALEYIADDLIATSSIHVQVDTAAFKENACSAELKLAIYRIVQEQFNNIRKYAKASTVWLTVAHKKKAVWLKIKDNGIGFDPAAQSKGVGLVNIKARAALFNGEMKLISSPGKGCELVVNFIGG
jgi:two-component system sensor histidine kinase UhpB